MKRILVMAALLLTGIVSVAARQVNEQDARQKAERFMVRRAMTRSVANMTRVYVPTRTVSAMESQNDAPLYFFNIDGGGYVIVSGDDRTVEVLGFSKTGHINPNRIPSNMRNWFDGYVRRIQSLPANASPKQCLTRAATSKADIAPKLKTSWGQDWPYNVHTPELHVVWNDMDTIVHAATGCVATSMAQMMNYYRYPDKTLMEHKSYTGTSDVPVGYSDEGSVDTLQVDWVTEDVPAGSAIDWANITDKYDEHSTEAQIEAVSRLIQYCGASVNMYYGMESSARTDTLVYGLYDTFGYTDVYLLHQMNYDIQGWIDVVYEALSNDGPLLFGGDCPNNKGGHQFILDGYASYDGADYFYANWGWDGENDGYMLLDVMSPGWIFDDDGNEIGFTESQVATPGLSPNSKGNALIDKNLYCEWLILGTEGEVYKRQSELEGFEVDYSFYFGNYDFPHTNSLLGMGIFQNDQLVDGFSFSEEALDLPLWYYWGGETESEDDVLSFGEGLGDGVYQIKLISRDVEEDEWKVCRFGDENAVVMTIEGNTATFGSNIPSGIKPIVKDRVDSATATWHTLSGTRLSGMPSAKGIYIHNGRKVVIK